MDGTILVADAAAPTKPVLAATHPEWIAPMMLRAPTFPFAASRLASYLMPETFQRYYTAAEPALAAALPAAQLMARTVPALLTPLAVAAADVAFVAGFALSALAKPLSAVGIAALVAARSSK